MRWLIISTPADGRANRGVSVNTSRMFLMGVTLGFFISVSNVAATTIETNLEGTWNSPVWGGTSGSQYQNVGETFTLQPGEDTVLDSIRFYVDDYADSSPSHAQIKFRLYVHVWDTYYDWPDPGQELFRSDLLMTNGLAGWQTFTVPIGGLSLETGAKYGWFISSVGENEDYGAAFVGLDYGPQDGGVGDAYPFGRNASGLRPCGLSADVLQLRHGVPNGILRRAGAGNRWPHATGDGGHALPPHSWHVKEY